MNIDKVALIGNVGHYSLLKIQMSLKMIAGDNRMVDYNTCKVQLTVTNH